MSRLALVSSATALIAILCPHQAHSQNRPFAACSHEEHEAHSPPNEQGLRQGFSGAAVNSVSAVEITAGAGDGKATIRIGRPSSIRTSQTPSCDYHSTQWTWSAAISTPTDDEGSATPWSLRGFPDSTTISLNFGRAWWREPRFINDSSVANDVCDEINSRRRPEPPLRCDQALLAQGTPDERRRAAQHLAPGPIWFVNGEATIGHHDMKFVDLATPEADSERHVEWGLSATAAVLLPQHRTLLSLTGQYREAYEDQDPGTQCPNTGGTVLVCETGPLGAPTLTRGASTTFEVRRRFDVPIPRVPGQDPLTLPLAIAPSVTYDFESDSAGVEIPVYFIGDDNGLNAGVRVSWDSENDDVTFGVFVSKTFTLIPG